MVSNNKKKQNPILIAKNILSKVSELSSGIVNNSHSYPGVDNNLLEWVLEDDDLRSRIEKKHSKLVETGYIIAHKDFKRVPDEVYDRLRQLRFHQWYVDSWWQEIIYYNSFTELGKDADGVVNQLQLIKTDEIEIVNLPNGKVVRYLQLPQTNDKNTPRLISLSPNRVFHISFSRLSTSLWGLSPIQTALPVIAVKRLIEHFIEWLFETNQFRLAIKVPDVLDEDQVDKFIELIKRSMRKVNNFLMIQGDGAEVKTVRDFKDIDNLYKILDYYNNKINNLLQLPPLETGIIESSNRSSSEYQVRYSYYSHIKSLLRRKAEQINNELFPALGLKDYRIIPKLVDDVSRKDLLSSAQMLMTLGAKPTELNKWLIANGLDIQPDLLREVNPEIAGADDKIKKPITAGKLQDNSDLYPSRNKKEMDFAGGSREK